MQPSSISSAFLWRMPMIGLAIKTVCQICCRHKWQWRHTLKRFRFIAWPGLFQEGVVLLVIQSLLLQLDQRINTKPWDSLSRFKKIHIYRVKNRNSHIPYTDPTQGSHSIEVAWMIMPLTKFQNYVLRRKSHTCSSPLLICHFSVGLESIVCCIGRCFLGYVYF